MLFNLDDIKELATVNSFERGEDLYQSGYVKKVSRIGNRFEGAVQGTYRYYVSLELADNGLSFHCNCPYDHGGICKHSVALALAVLKDEYTGHREVINNLPETKPAAFDECYNNADIQKKMSFLKQLLDKDTDLQNQFMAFFKSKSENLDSITGINIDLLKKEIHDELNSLDFTDIVESYDPYSDGYYDDDGIIDIAYEAIRDIINPYKNKSLEYLKKGNLLDSIRIVMGMYEASQNLTEPEDSDYDIFYEDYSTVVLDLLIEAFDKITIEIERIVKSDEIISQVIDLIIQRFNYYESLYAGIDDEENEEVIFYHLKIFEKLFISLITDKETAEYFYNIILQNDLERLNMAFVLLKIAEISENEELWISTAETFSEYEQEIGMQLLEKYKQKNEPNDFNRIAGLTFNKWPDRFDLYLIDNLDNESEKTLYVKALKNYTVHKKSVKHYKELREFLNEEERKEFVDRIGQGYEYVFYVQLLETEKRYSDILAFLKKKKDTLYNFEKFIAPIANIYPDECFMMIQNKCNEAMNDYKRNRKTYREMVEWLIVMDQIKSKKEETKQFLRYLYAHKPNLPALKDELRKAGLHHK